MSKYKYESPLWFRVLFIAFIGYVVVYGMFRGEETGEQSNIEKLRNLPSVQNITNKENYAPLLSTDDAIRIVTSEPGEGSMLRCGDHVDVKLRGTTPSGDTFDADHNEEEWLTLKLGAVETLPALSEGIVGMRGGEVRRIHAPYAKVYEDPSSYPSEEGMILFRVHAHASKQMRTGISDPPIITEIIHQGSGAQVRCGESMRLRIEAWNVKGDALSLADIIAEGEGDIEEDLLHFYGGDSFIGLNYAAEKIRANETRRAAIPAHMSGKMQEMLVLEITRVK